MNIALILFDLGIVGGKPKRKYLVVMFSSLRSSTWSSQAKTILLKWATMG